MNLTPRQREILALLHYREDTGRPWPSRAEIAAYLGVVNRATVQKHLERMEQKGLITRDKRGRVSITRRSPQV